MSKVSVFMSSYNYAKYLSKAIDSVLHQTYTDYELFIVDDASTDNSWSIIQSYTAPHIHTFKNINNQNDVQWMNKVILEMASGEYIAIHHSDNIWETEKLQQQVEYLESHPEIGAVFTKTKTIDEDGKAYKNKAHFLCQIFDQPNRTRYEWLNFFFYHGNALCHPSVLIRKKCYDECGFYRYGLAQLRDLDMWVRLCLKYDLHVLPQQLVQYRVQNNETFTSGIRPETKIRLQFEYLMVLENYLTIATCEELFKIFPAAEKYRHPKGCDIGFVLAMVTLETRNDLPIFNLFALRLLFNALNDPIRANKIEKRYGFRHKDFISLTAKHDVFSTVAHLNVFTKLTDKLKRHLPR